jgi:hypothetical protein
VSYNFETFVFPNMECLSLYGVLFSTFVQKLNSHCTDYIVFQNIIRYSSKNLNVLNALFSKQNISCFEIRWQDKFDQLI